MLPSKASAYGGNPPFLYDANDQDVYAPAAKVPQLGSNGPSTLVRAPLRPSPYPESAATASSSGLTSSPQAHGATFSSRAFPDAAGSPPFVPSSRKRSRKEKPQIQLAADQPPTTQGKQRIRVFVACLQCRSRKIRCDGAKPSCHNCTQRPGGDPCDYDSTPKRRGPDRVQGARTRTVRPKDDTFERPVKRRRRRATPASPAVVIQAAGGSFSAGRRTALAETYDPGSSNEIPLESSLSQEPSPVALVPSQANELSNLRFPAGSLYGQGLLLDTSPASVVSTSPIHVSPDLLCYTDTYSTAVSSAYIEPAEEQAADDRDVEDLGLEPSVQFSRKVWWDHVLHLYSTSSTYNTRALTQTQRDLSSSNVINDIRYLFRSTSYWFSFINVPRFYNNFLDPVRRSSMQPSLILSALAVSTYLQSSQLGRGENGRRMAMMLRNEAQSFFDASLSSRYVDEELAQAAWMLAFFEVLAHPAHSTTRVLSSLQVLDNVIRTLSLTCLDAGNPQASTYSPRSVPSTISSPSPPPPAYAPDIRYYSDAVPPAFPAHAEPPGASCSCEALSLGRNWPECHEQAPSWIWSPAWNHEWGEGEVRREECRRLSWSAMMLVAGHSSYSSASSTAGLDMFMIEPSNYSILFPGEALLPLQYFDAAAGKETVWALYIRAMLLWNSCVRFRGDASHSDADRSAFAMRAWLESEAIERLLDRHSCGVERAWLYVGREYLFNTRYCISYEFQRFIPHVLTGLNRQKSAEWLREQGTRAKVVILGMHTITGNMKSNLAHRPWFVWWFMGQANRALTLWSLDNSLVIALDVTKAFLEPIDFLTAIYPCSEQRNRYERLKERLRLACLSAEASGQYSQEGELSLL
ncbi:hypothetical protein FA95DRAFT_1562170 [Auriscalpium vulgare]|uniref:Uncharacterized protein n=1 Tax=Auriscalpium vulgare TaxID=40419 RepID=A0ACB8RK69_9AGAM|nr:hypothetical protein FA95DRAFT_1562170 [Auriscalpium vulgare]